MKNKLFWMTTIFFVLSIQSVVHSQRHTISGNIYDKESAKPLPHSSIFLTNKPNIGTFTDEKGFFSLKVDISDTLFISHIGYESIKIAVSDFKNKVMLEQNTKQLKEFAITAKKKRTNVNIEKLGTYWSGHDIYWHIRGYANYTLLISNEIKREGVIKSAYFRIKHEKDKSKKYKNNYIQLRIRIYSVSTRPDKPSVDLVQENIFITMRQNQNSIRVDLEKYNIAFPKNGIMLGLDIMGYLDKEGKLIDGSNTQCIKNIYLRQTNRSELKQTFFKSFSNEKWIPTSRFPKPQTNEFYTLNVMFGAEVIFEKDE